MRVDGNRIIRKCDSASLEQPPEQRTMFGAVVDGSDVLVIGVMEDPTRPRRVERRGECSRCWRP
jgi:hypothetical protein